MEFNGIYPLVMTNIAMENPRTKWWFLAGNIIYKWAMASMAMLNNRRVIESKFILLRCEVKTYENLY